LPAAANALVFDASRLAFLPLRLADSASRTEAGPVTATVTGMPLAGASDLRLTVLVSLSVAGVAGVPPGVPVGEPGVPVPGPVVPPVGGDGSWVTTLTLDAAALLDASGSSVMVKTRDEKA
jgi:hypothetical protein